MSKAFGKILGAGAGSSTMLETNEDVLNYLQEYVREMPKNESHFSGLDKLNEILKQIAQTTETATVGYTNGAFLGNFDEFMGGATVATTLNQNNYLMGRDAVRQLSNNLYQQNPYLYAIAETLGAATTA